VLGATLKAGETTTYALGKDRSGYLVPAVGSRRSQRRQAERPRRRGHQGRGRHHRHRLEDAELVLVDAA
jgi:hypothetical protein